MKKISKEDAAQIVLMEGKSSAVRTALINLQPGEILQIDKADWKQRNGPQQMITRLEKGTTKQFKVRRFANKQGWLVERVR
ncbi:MAG: hypothetical protein V4615_07595 [Bacteroidota bacterium]